MKAKDPKKKKKSDKCTVRGCSKRAQSQGYCRLCYIKHWKDIQEKGRDRALKRLNAYVNRLSEKYPDDYLEKIKEGIEDEEVFKKSVQDLEVDAEDHEPETDREYLEKFGRNIKGE